MWFFSCVFSKLMVNRVTLICQFIFCLTWSMQILFSVRQSLSDKCWLSLCCFLPSCSQDTILLHKRAYCVLSWRWSSKPCIHMEISLLLSFSCPTQWWCPMSSYLYLTLGQWGHPQPMWGDQNSGQY